MSSYHIKLLCTYVPSPLCLQRPVEEDLEAFVTWVDRCQNAPPHPDSEELGGEENKDGKKGKRERKRKEAEGGNEGNEKKRRRRREGQERG